MNTRRLGTAAHVSEIGLGCWQLGADWGPVNEADAIAILHEAIEHGVTFLDTADVYGAGRSERLIGKVLSERSESLFVATKAGRRNYPGPYTRETLREHVQESIANLGVETLDLLQLHCVPTETLRDGEIFDWLRAFQTEGLIRHFGASVESMEEAQIALTQEGLTSLQIIFNIFRQKPIDELFVQAAEKDLGLIIRLPLASGLLAGKFTEETTFPEDDHRNYNCDGQCFNVGETFAGLRFKTGLHLVEQLRPHVPADISMAQFAQRWILDHPAVSSVITGASKIKQVTANTAVAELPPLDAATHDVLRSWYRKQVASEIRGPY